MNQPTKEQIRWFWEQCGFTSKLVTLGGQVYAGWLHLLNDWGYKVAMNGEDPSEKDFSKQVEDLLNLFGWQWCHFRPARTEHGWRTALSGHQGFPDYIAVKSSRLLVFELKSEKGKVIPQQEGWLEVFRATGMVEVYLWRPSDFEKIVECLRKSN